MPKRVEALSRRPSAPKNLRQKAGNGKSAKAVRRKGPSRKTLDKRQLILAAAAKVFKEKGFSETSLSDIGKEAGTFAGSLYYHFASKHHLVDAVLEFATTGMIDRFSHALEQLPRGSSYRERIRAALRFHLTQVMEKDNFILAYWKIIDQVPADLRAKHLSKPHAYDVIWEDLIKRAKKAGEIRKEVNTSIFRMLLVGATNTGLDWYHLGLSGLHAGGTLTPDRLADQMIDILFEGSATSKS